MRPPHSPSSRAAGMVCPRPWMGITARPLRDALDRLRCATEPYRARSRTPSAFGTWAMWSRLRRLDRSRPPSRTRNAGQHPWGTACRATRRAAIRAPRQRPADLAWIGYVARSFGSLIRFQWPPVNTYPRFHIIGKPDLALGKVGNGLWEVASHGDLVRPLSADSTKPHPDLMGTHEMESHAHHTHDYRHPTILEPRGRHAPSCHQGTIMGLWPAVP